MKEEITPDRIANSILQDKTFSGTYLLVEGNNDFLVYNKFIDNQNCEIKIAHGFQNVIDAVDILKKRGFDISLGIIDNDFRVIQNAELEHDDVFVTDDHDIELMAFRSESFDTLISHYSDKTKVDKLIKEKGGPDLRTVILELARPIGFLKLANKSHGFGFIFKPLKEDGNPLKLTDIIATNTLNFNGWDVLIEKVINYSRNKTEIRVSQEQAIQLTTELAKNTFDLYHICNGHDICYIIAISLRKKLSSMNVIAPEQIEKDLMFGFDSRCFQKTQLYSKLKTWEAENGKVILKF